MIEVLTKYRESPAVNQSLIKSLLSGIGTFKKKEKDLFAEEDEHFILGSASDTMLLTPEVFNQIFYISELENKPSDTIMSIIRDVYDKKSEGFTNIESTKRLIWEAANSRSYFANRINNDIDKDTRIPSIIKDGKDYWEELIKSNKRTILSNAELGIVNAVVDSFKHHPHTADYFDDKLSTHAQVAIYFKYKDLDCKALLDYIIFDHEQKTIQPIEIKTMGGSTKTFPISAKRFRYDIQIAWYDLALRSVDKLKINDLYEIDIKDYIILPFKFLVESTDMPGVCPLVYTATSYDYITGRYGCVVQKDKIIYHGDDDLKLGHNISTRSYYGYEQGISLYKWHKENEFWEMDKELYEKNGEIELNVFCK